MLEHMGSLITRLNQATHLAMSPGMCSSLLWQKNELCISCGENNNFLYQRLRTSHWARTKNIKKTKTNCIQAHMFGFHMRTDSINIYSVNNIINYLDVYRHPLNWEGAGWSSMWQRSFGLIHTCCIHGRLWTDTYFLKMRTTGLVYFYIPVLTK